MLKKIVVILLFSFGIVVLGKEVPHSYIWENPDKEVTQTETLKRHKDKAELNISVTKLKSESIPMKHNIDEKKIYFELSSNEVKRVNGDIKLEPTDRIFISEELETVPSVSTTNGRRKINGLKRLNKSLDKGTLKNGNLTWTVKDLRAVETKKAVEINYGIFPKSLYVGVTDKDYNLKKVFVGKMSDLELYNVDDLKGYVSTFEEDTYVSNGYAYDISDIVMWTKDNKYVDIKFLEMNIAPISDPELIAKNPYLAVEEKAITFYGQKNKMSITGNLHIVNRSESSLLPETRTENLYERIDASLNFAGTSTKELKTAVYVRFEREKYQSLLSDIYEPNRGGVYGHNDGMKVVQLPNMKLTNEIITDSKKVTVDFWLFGTDFSDKANYVLDPRNNGTGNLKIRVQDENGSITDAVSAGTTDSVFDMVGRMAKFDFDDTTRVEIQNISGFTVTQQNQGSYFHNRNRWAEGTIPGYKIRARIWSDYDGLELDIEKNGVQDTSTEGVRSFKIIQTHSNGKVIQEITVNLYVNNYRISEREKFNITRTGYLDIDNGNYDATFDSTDREGKRTKNGDTMERGTPIFQISMIGKEGDFKEHFPIYSSGIIMFDGSNYVTLSNNKQYISEKPGNIGILSFDKNYYISQYMGNGLYTLKLAHNFQKPEALITNKDVYTQYYHSQNTYYTYGAGKRKGSTNFMIRVASYKNPPSDIRSRTVELKGVPLLIDKSSGLNNISSGNVYKNFTTQELVTDNTGWLGGDPNWVLLYGKAKVWVKGNLIINGSFDTPEGEEQYKNFRYETENLGFGVRPNDHAGYFAGFAMGLKHWFLAKIDREIEGFKITGGSERPNIGGEYQEDNVKVIVKAFDATFMWDKTASSIQKTVVITKELDMRSEYVPTKQVLEVGEVYFRYLNIKALKQNTNQSAKFVLPDSAYLVFRDGTNPNNRINVRLSFASDSIVTAFEMEDRGGDYAGGNGKKVYMHIETEEYKKLIANGPNREYRVKGSYSSNKYGVPNESDTVNVIKIGLIATTDPDGRTRNEPFYNTVVDNMNLITKKITPIIYTIKYDENQPWIAGYDMWIANKNIEYTSMPSGYNYSNSLSIVGDATPYDFFIRAHTYQVVDTTGIPRSGQIASAGSGAYWDDLTLGPHKAKLYHSKEFGTKEGYEIRELIYFNLKEYNSYDAYNGKILEKHYQPYSRNINQYYEINVDIPEFNPYVYYNETKSIDTKVTPIKLRDSIEVQKIKGQTKYILGSISTHNYDMEITKKTSGSYIDTLGLRMIPNNRSDGNGITLYEVNEDGSVGNAHSTKAKIFFVDAQGNKISYDMNNPNGTMVGANQSIRVALEIPSNLNPQKNYKILGTTDRILDKNQNIPTNFNLIIGRNKYFKEIIKEIVIKREKLEGSFTITFDNNYSIREMAKFKATTLSAREQVELEKAVTGVTLSSKVGEGFLQLESGDTFQIEIAGKTQDFLIPTTLKVDKQEFVLADGITKMAFKIENGRIQVGLNYWEPNKENTVIFRVIRDNYEAMIQTMKVVNPKSQFIVTHKEVLDFGNVFQNTKNNYAEARLGIENSGDIVEVNFEINDTTPLLENVKDETKTLEVREINGALFRKSSKEYEMIVNGFLDVPEKATVGEYKGSIIIKLHIK
jgi:hypothetical protein